MVEFHPVMRIVGLLLATLGLTMLVPAAADAAAGNTDWQVFLASAAVTVFVGGGLVIVGSERDAPEISLRSAFLLTTVSWVAVSLAASLPFLFFGHGMDLADAVFEAVSGLTTTGSTVMTGLDTLPVGILLWRAVLQWVGGIGIIVMAIMILPFLRVGGMQLFQAESSDRSEKVLPRPQSLVAHIVGIYTVLTLAATAAFAAAGMDLFDAVTHAMTSVSTGGYSTHDASLGHFDSAEVEWVAVLFMLSGALPFVAYIHLVRGQPARFVRDPQIRFLLAFLAAVILATGIWLSATHDMAFHHSVRLAAFNITSIVTTTGYASGDYQAWGPFAFILFFMLMFVGGCTGSTSGALKALRFIVLAKVGAAHLRQLSQPHRISPLRYAGQPIPDDTVRSVLAFVAAFASSAVALTVALSFFGLDFTTSLSGAVTAMTNVGPGLGDIIGPAGTFQPLPDGAKWLLSAGMLLGRLELFTVLVIFTPSFWRW